MLETVAFSGAAAGLTERVYREYQRHDRLEPTTTDITTVHTSAQLAHTPLGWDDVYAQARDRAHGQHALEMVVMGLCVLGLLYGTYRSLRKIFR